MNFKQHNKNPLVSLGVGQIHLIKSWLDEMGVKNYIINDDFTIDVNDCVELIDKNLFEFPYYIQFNKIRNYFSCSNNQLTSLRGCPKYVGTNFYCNNNQLTSLEGCPKEVDVNFHCGKNKKRFTENEVRKLCNVNLKIIC